MMEEIKKELVEFDDAYETNIKGEMKPDPFIFCKVKTELQVEDTKEELLQVSDKPEYQETSIEEDARNVEPGVHDPFETFKVYSNGETCDPPGRKLFTYELHNNSSFENNEEKTNTCLETVNTPITNRLYSFRFDECQEEKSFKCSLCGKSFTEKCSFTRHMRIHTGQKPFVCNNCSMSFSDKYHLNRHMRLHTGLKPFSCTVCGKLFSHKHNLNTHMLMHAGQKPFVCNICNKSFSKKFSLTKHMYIHTGNKSFTCSVCNTSFSEKYNLVKHMRIHTGQKPFTCDICFRSFAEKSNLNKHTLIHMSKKSFSCDICRKSFLCKSHLTSHVCENRLGT